MAPIHDTDVAENRWTQAEWEHYELWEKIEHRLHLRRRLWVIGTAVVYLLISAVPIVNERWPKWAAGERVSELAEIVNRVKFAAISDHSARVLLLKPGLEIEVFKTTSCPAVLGTLTAPIEKTQIGTGPYDWVSPSRGAELGVPGIVSELCFDPIHTEAGADQSVNGVAVAPIPDLQAGRSDRWGVATFSGAEQTPTFE